MSEYIETVTAPELVGLYERLRHDPKTGEPVEPPSSNTGVTLEKNLEIAGHGFYGWDWSATTHDARDEVVIDLVRALGAHHVVPGKGLQGWSQSVKCYDAEGFALGAVYFGGGREDVHVLSTSSEADAARRAVVGMDRARTSRVDTRVDTLIPFERLVAVLEAAAETYGSRLIYMESKERGESLGRTLYLGAPSSIVRVRVYEKWLQAPGEYAEGTNRVEVQLRPQSKVKERVSQMGPAETFCASKTTRDLAERLGADFAPVTSVRLKRGTPDLEQSLEAMGEQYRNVVERWLNFSGGDLGKVIDYLVPRTELA